MSRSRIQRIVVMVGLALIALSSTQARADQPGTISGVVSDFAEGSPYFCFAEVYAYDSEGSMAGHDFTVSSSGEYEIGNLAAGEYRVQASRYCADPSTTPMTGLPPRSEFYNGKQTLADATPVLVSAGAATVDIDMSMAPGDWIEGTVTDEEGNPLRYICVQAFNGDGLLAGVAGTGPNGQYRMTWLGAGSFRLKFSDCFGFYDYPDIAEFYEDKATLEQATPVSVTETGDGVSGIDARLDTRGWSDRTAPDTIIDSGPAGSISTPEATFHFSSTDPPGTASYECSIDSGEFAACTSPTTFSGLDDGTHTVQVRAEDASGNKDLTPASRSFTVDTTVYWATVSRAVVVGPSRLKKDRPAVYALTVTNAGNASANDVSLDVKGRGIVSGVRIGQIPSGASRTVRVNLSPKKRGKVKLVFKVTSTNAGARKVVRKISVN